MIITSGNRNDITQVEELTRGFCASYLLADKGYDGERALLAAKNIGATPIIPQRQGARAMRKFDVEAYKARHLIENLFQPSRNSDDWQQNMINMCKTTSVSSISPLSSIILNS